MKIPFVGTLKSFVEFLFPAACPLCDAPVSTHGELCGDCWCAFAWIDGAKCSVCGYPFSSELDLGASPMCAVCAAGNNEMDLIRSASVYDDASRAAMLPFKHGGRIAYSRFMSRAMIWSLRDVDADFDVVMPVPLARRRLIHRTYNQATLLGHQIARAAGKPLDVDSVRRRHRPDMGRMNAHQRKENIRGVFTVVNPDKIRDKKILLVDDVFTSGATLNELHRVLIRAGARSVCGVTFARVVKTV